MTSRLDRLFLLLEAGAGAATRRAAARQLGEIQKAHPEELHRLLGRLLEHLRSPAWETRVAAAQAVEAILANVPEWHPTPPVDDEVKKEEKSEEEGRLRCEDFDLASVLRHGAHLMGSEGREYDLEEEALGTADIKERLTKQRQQLNSRLGLDVAAKLGVDLTAVYSNDDLCLAKPAPSTETRRPVQELVPISSKKLSSREINLAKRKARQAFCKQKSRDCEEGGAGSSAPAEPAEKKVKLEVEEFMADGLAVPDCSNAWSASDQWPLRRWCSALQTQLLAANWEARHGAASALRELLRAKVARGAAKASWMDLQQMEDAHQEWLEDMALRLLCVLALDRFGDFISDQVIAPVRETCAQTLGVCLAAMRAARVRGVAQLLAALAQQPQWEPRHGAMLGFKYLLAARQDVAIESGALDYLMRGLEDTAEDVSGVAAVALAPAAGALATRRGRRAARVLRRLWRLLRPGDAPAPADAYMALLAALLSLPDANRLLHPIDLADVLPRLWPYLDHSTSSVRKATLQTLYTLTKPLVKPKNYGQTNGDDAKEAPNEQCSDGEQMSDEPMSDDEGKTEMPVCKEPADFPNWTPELLQEAMRYIYQRVLFEHVHEIQEIALKVWENLLVHAPLSTTLVSACPVLATWLCLAMQPARLHVDPGLLLQPATNLEACPDLGKGEVAPPPLKWYVGGSESQSAALRDSNVMRARCLAADMLGYLSCYLVQPAPGIEYKPEDESPIDCYVKVMVHHLRSGSALQRLVASLVVASWASHAHEKQLYPPEMTQSAKEGNETEIDVSKLAPPLLATTLHTALNQVLYYDEVALNCNRILQEARDLHAMLKHYKLPVDGEEFSNIIRLEQVLHLSTKSQSLVAGMKLKRVSGTLEERRRSLHAAAALCAGDQAALSISVQAAIAGACAHLDCLPQSLNPVIRPLMESIKREQSEELQSAAAQALAALLRRLRQRNASPADKVLANLKAFLKCDPEYTPRINLDNLEETADSSDSEGTGTHSTGPALDRWSGILTLWEQQKAAERGAPRRGRPPASLSHSHTPHTPTGAPTGLGIDFNFAKEEDESRKQLRIQRRGATLALRVLVRGAGAALPTHLPKLWEFITQPFESVLEDEQLEAMSPEAGEELISRLQVIEVVAGNLGPLLETLRPRLGALAALTRSPRTAIRHMAARALAALALHDTPHVMDTIVQHVVCGLASSSVRVRSGAAEAVSRVVDALQLLVVPYIVLLVVPLLGRMSDQCEAVRVMSTRCFAALILLMPLDGGAAPPDLPAALRARREQDHHFLHQLFNPATIPDYHLPIAISAELRSYQQAGVNWLRFLHSYQLHGVLCDDMGLGKTLQSIVAVAAAHLQRPQLPSLVVCPPTLTGHWVFEVNKFIPSKFLKPLQFVGPPTERVRLRSQIKYYNLIVASYDIVRKDIEFFRQIKWNYCVLDEGHVIKNGKTKAFKAIKQLVANHRLILSGTPIQNNVLELWSLFDFLMPGLLGTERQFTVRYSKPILAARDAKATPHQLQAGALACEALHRQVLPFLLRRVKEDVLKELPPKITQDYYCELSPLQRRLYEHFAREMPVPNSGHAHVFQALHYLQNVCNHPRLALCGEQPAAAAAAARELLAADPDLTDIHHAAKLPALKQLLLDCGIGAANPDGESIVSQHRALVFCQRKKMLDIVEEDLLKKHLPSVTYLRLDGNVPSHRRHAIVTQFNSDVSIDLLLLTTQVGGLGLNLTGADTVIFVEHDWNPMRDLQAMDRAHRIGQKRVVNVYRLITRDTLEEKILGLQKFKLLTANTVISSENAAMETMGTEQLLELFQGPSQTPATPTTPATELWDDTQYSTEYDLDTYVQGLNNVTESSGEVG